MENLKSVNTLYVYKNETLLGELSRTRHGTSFSFYDVSKLNKLLSGISFLMPYEKYNSYELLGDNLPPYFAGLLPEGRRLSALIETVKTSEDDLFSLLAATGHDVVGDISLELKRDRSTDTEQKTRITLENADFEELFEKSIYEKSYDSKKIDVSFPGVYTHLSMDFRLGNLY